MLSRTADHLFWMMRYLERAETTARLLEVGARSALMPDVSGGYRNDWEAVLQASGGYDDFLAKYGETKQRNIETFLFFDESNPSVKSSNPSPTILPPRCCDRSQRGNPTCGSPGPRCAIPTLT